MTDEVRFERLIDAPCDVVFDMFTDSGGQVAFYRGPEPAWIVRSHCDLRVGGEWLVDFGPSEDEMYHHRHVFDAIDRPHRLRMTTTETRVDGFAFETETEFVFEDRGDKTLMILLHRGFPTPELRDEHAIGLPAAFAQFERFAMSEPRH